MNPVASCYKYGIAVDPSLTFVLTRREEVKQTNIVALGKSKFIFREGKAVFSWMCSVRIAEMESAWRYL